MQKRSLLETGSVSDVEYTAAQKLAGLDLYGLPCRIPEPTSDQSKCTHTKPELVYMGDGYVDDNEEWVRENRWMDVTTFEDIPGTNNMRCTICGYTRRY